MAKKSDQLALQLLQALKLERGVDVGLLDEIKAISGRQVTVLQEEWDAQVKSVDERAEASIAEINRVRELELSNLNDMFTNLITVNKTIIDRVDGYVQKISGETIYDLLPNHKSKQLVGAGDGNTFVVSEQPEVPKMEGPLTGAK